METLGEGEDGATVNRELESWHQLPVEEDPSQFLGQTSGLLEADGLQGITLNSEGQMAVIGDSGVQPAADKFESLQLELQDSCLSPALTLIPQGKSFLPSESTLLHQTDLEFVPLRGSPDLSIASERCPQMSRLDVDGEFNLTHRSHEHPSLSQHHLGMMSAILEDASSCCSLSQHSLSPSSTYQAAQIHDKEHSSGLESNDEWQKEGEEKFDANLDRRGTACGLSSSVPVHSSQKLLKTDLGVASSSAVPSSSETVLSQTDAVLRSIDTPESQIKHSGLAQKQDPACTSTKEPQFRPSESREQPQGGSSSLLSQRRTMERGSVSLSSRLSAISNITVRSKVKQTDDTTDLPLRQLQLHSDSSLSASGGRNQTENKNTPAGQNITPASEGGVHMAGLQRALWSSGSQQAADGSFLTSQPVFQSTPAVLLGRGAQAPAKLSPVYSHQDTVATSTQNSSPKPDDIPALTLSTTSHQSVAGVTLATSLDPGEVHTESHLQHEIPHSQEAPSPGLDVPVIACENRPLDQPTLATLLHTSDQQLKDQEPRLSAGRVHSLPSLSYVQKVDAWKANQNSSRSFYDNLSLQGFDGVPPKRKEQDSVSEAIKHQSQHHPNKTCAVFSANSSTPPTQTGSGVLSCADVEEAGGAVGSTSPSPFTQSHSHSSLGTVITPIQQDELQQNQNQLPLVCTDSISPGFISTAAESSLSSSGTNDQRPADDAGTGPVKTPALLSVDQYSGVSLNTNRSNPVSSFPGGCHVEQSFQASLGAASSVVSLEVDNYAPYWTAGPESPPRHPEFNIEDRIPLYLHNLGIDQSPSTILNPFTHRGPIREPEFSPTDLCTIKGSVGTPNKSIQQSDGDSLQKETCSSSSVLSADSSASLTQLFIQKPIQLPARPASSGSIRMAHFQTGTSPEHHTPSCSVPQGADTSHREGSYGLPAQVSLECAPAPGTWDGVKEGDSSLVGSGTLQEIRRLLGHAESIVSGHFSVASTPGSQCYAESDAPFLSLKQNTQAYHDDSFLSVDGKISLVLAHSSSDSGLKDSSSSSSGPLEQSSKSDHMSKGPSTSSQGREENPKSRDFCVAPRRAEPEGCSAADPDRVGPVSLLITQGHTSSISDSQQQSQDHTENSGISSSKISPTHSQTEAEMGVLSDASSEHSLASRVAKLLQSESSASVVTSRSSTADPEESHAREWIMMKVSGGKCQALELNAEDRRRIEEIKRELLLHTKHTKSSSDSESSTQSSVGAVPQPAVGFAAMRSAEDRLSEQLQRVSRIPLDSFPLHTPLEDGVSQIAIKEAPQHTPSPQSARHCLHTHNSLAAHNDTALESNSYTTLRSSEEWKLQTQMTNSTTKNEAGKGTVGKDKEVRDENEHPESERNDPLSIPEAPQPVLRGKREFPPGLESGSSLDHKPHLSNSHLTPSVKLQQNTIQRPHTPAGESCSYPELRNGSQTHHSDSPNTSREVPLPVSSTTEEQQASVSSETSLSTDRNEDQGQNTGMVSGYSQMTSRYPQAFTPSQRLAGPSRSLLINTAAIPTLLPYKPHGSSELFYMPQSVPEISPNRSDTTVESSHPGSDDAVPPQFTPEVLGSRELVDKNVTPKHKEGIYSKRAKMKRESTLFGKGFHDPGGNTGPPYQLTGFSRSDVPENEQVAEQIEEGEVFIPLHMEADYSTTELHPNHSVQKHNLGTETLPLLTKAIRQKEQDMKAHDLGAEIGSSLDQLWRRFNERCSLQETRAANDVEISLLERLERLSRLLHSSSLPHTSKQAHSREEKGKSRRREHEPRRTQGKDTTKKGKERSEVRSVPKTAWEKESLSTNQKLVEKEQQETDYRCPAERDESASVSVETSSSQSTIDTQRLIRAFGPHRVSSGRERVAGSQTLKPSDGLLKLYNTIKKQKRGHGKSSSENHPVSVATEISNTDDSMASDTLSSSSTYTLPSQRGTGRTTSSKRAKVKLVSRSIQAGDLEIVVNGTRRDTRDVGTTFPSPCSARITRTSSAACSELKASMSALRASSAAPVQSQPVLRRQALNKQTCYPNGLSWFVSADELKWDARKENKPQTDAGQTEGQAWFQPYTRTQPWREPLRERHIQAEREEPPEQKTHSESDGSSKSSALVRLSLQEALELHRPEFVSRSRERMKRLCLLVEDRKMQAVFNKEREDLFNRPSTVKQPKAAPAPPPLPSKRIIPISEMIQRSKRIYAQLPEVQKRKEEERKKAEYNTYRLNAQLFNKKVTNRVLGRRAPWQ
ncbi:centrosome-associated protein ALMS1 [Pangasianodon hypophthalmus]|uniref:centrosome-associated protein ALMS1 n=1 Tax=Pangasianodon hypophthalmus TaxID=310915 RepID=UPI002307B0A6|nr:centrosome-associated protein ALMS1 [Pangasianodon hypophthalmus]